MKKLIYTPLLLLFMLSCSNGHVKIEWVDNVEGDFSFIEKWDYANNVFTNEYGQLVCDGFCTEEIDKMRDKDGRILTDSMTRYYQLLDTTHFYFTMEHINMQNNMPGSTYTPAHIHMGILENDTLALYAPDQYAGYWGIDMKIKDDICIPQIHLTSVTTSGDTTITCKEGIMRIDKKLWKEGIIKAYYKFNFSEERIWEGKIYKSIR